MSKKRLEEIREKYSRANVIEHLNGIDIIAAAKEDIVWLIEQAERAQKLERKIERYREALEFYANEETYEMKFTANTDEISVPLTVIELDEGKKARQALEGEE